MRVLHLIFILVLAGSYHSYAQFTQPLPAKAKADSVPLTAATLSVSRIISPDHYKKQLGFFCLKELQVEKALRVPLKLRLGALDYCNYLEGKNMAYPAAR